MCSFCTLWLEIPWILNLQCHFSDIPVAIYTLNSYTSKHGFQKGPLEAIRENVAAKELHGWKKDAISSLTLELVT